MEEESRDETIYREVRDMWFDDLRPVLENTETRKKKVDVPANYAHN
jgi:hypothetical protein